ncbi:DUF4861 family protein [Foetidibacter luteolus]|uniref:DUF4861 family protein n=1 Tax=Foetidibacter luteolus TaxID=2608880 RepID=UPI00129B67E9|nr:DUF4861 family protein [Foetidibacter luteolus]
MCPLSKLFSSTIAVLLLITCQAQQVALIISNPADTERTDELIILKRAEVEARLGKIAEGRFLTVKDRNGKNYTLQLDDLDGDGHWDEAVFLLNIKALETLNLQLEVNSKAETQVQRAHVRLKKKNADDSFGPDILKETMPPQNPPTDFSKTALPMYLTEGPGWENDKIAFRQYFDTRNTKDIYGKLQPGMVMDKVGTKNFGNYHQLAAWGMDLLKVGKSLGAGSVAIATKNADGNDTLIRLGGNNIQKQEYERVADGPVRAIFRIHYQWQVNDNPVEIIEENSICGGQYFYQSTYTIKGIAAGSSLVAGIANFYNNTPGNFYKDGAAVLYSYGLQSENKDSMGLALITSRNATTGFGKAPDAASDILNSYLLYMPITQQPLTFRFYACWQKAGARFSSMQFFTQYLQSEVAGLNTPLRLNW